VLSVGCQVSSGVSCRTRRQPIRYRHL